MTMLLKISQPPADTKVQREEIKQDMLGKPRLIIVLREESKNELKVGKAVKNGDCFFDSLEQALHSVPGMPVQTIKSLRQICWEYAKADPQGNFKNWFLENTSEIDTYDDYLKRVQYSSAELEKPEYIIWGNDIRDGQIICWKLKINIHVINILDDGTVEHRLITPIGIGDPKTNPISYTDQKTIHLAIYKKHYVPLISAELYKKLYDDSLHRVTSAGALASAQTQSFADVKSNRSNGPVRHDTKAEGDCGFHALLGDLSSSGGRQQYECKNVNEAKGERAKVANKIKECKPGDKIHKLVVAGVEDLVMNDNRNVGSAIQRLQKAYKAHVSRQDDELNVAATSFESCLLKPEYEHIVNHIKTSVQAEEKNNPSPIPRNFPSLCAQFQFCLNIKTNGASEKLKTLMQSSEELSNALQTYNRIRDKGFDLEARMAADPEIIQNYAAYIARPKQWLLPHEVGLIAHVNGITVKVYTNDAKKGPFSLLATYNPGTNDEREVFYDSAARHYERITRNDGAQAALSRQDLPNSADEKAARPKNVLNDCPPVSSWNQPKRFPAAIKKKMFSMLTVEDLKSFRTVSRSWSKMSTDLLCERAEQTSPDKLRIVEESPLADELRKKIYAVICKVFPVHRRQTIKIKSLTASSPVASTFSLTIDDQKYVIRAVNDSASLTTKIRQDNSVEFTLSAYYAALNISPFIHYLDLSALVMIMDFIPNQEQWSNNVSDMHIRALTNMLQRLHRFHPIKQKLEVSRCGLYLTRLNHSKQAIVNASPKFDFYQRAITVYQQLESSIASSMPTHNDLTRGNLLFDGVNYFVIDFECAGLGDVFFDLATLVLQFNLGSAAEQKLLHNYLQREPTIIERSRYLICKQLVYLRFSLSLFGNCDHSQVQIVDLDKIVPFSEFWIGGPKASLKTEQGKFYISISLMKEALKGLQTHQYEQALQLTSRGIVRNRFEYEARTVNYKRLFPRQDLTVPVIKRLGNFLASSDLKTMALVNSRWNRFSHRVWCSKKNSASPKGIELIPDEKKQQYIASVLRDNFIVDHKKPYSIEPLHGGLSDTASVYKITIDDHVYVLRLLTSSLTQKEVAREVLTTFCYGENGISPKTQFFSIQQRTIIIDFVPIVKNWGKSLQDNQLQQLIELVSALHELKFNNFAMYFGRNMRRASMTNKYMMLDPRAACFQRYSFVAEQHRLLSQQLACYMKEGVIHRDLNPGNILYDGSRFWLIDWETSGEGNVLFDLATMAIFLRLDKAREKRILETYFGTAYSKADEVRYMLFKQLALLEFSLIISGTVSQSQLASITKEQITRWPIYDKSVKIDPTSEMGRIEISMMLANTALQNISNGLQEGWCKQLVAVTNNQPKFKI